jgi:hypothetical protein
MRRYTLILSIWKYCATPLLIVTLIYNYSVEHWEKCLTGYDPEFQSYVEETMSAEIGKPMHFMS